MVKLSSELGRTMLQDAESHGTFLCAAKHFEGQAPLQCGSTSLKIALNVVVGEKNGNDWRQTYLPSNMWQQYSHIHSAAGLREELRARLNPQHRWFSTTLNEIGSLAAQYTHDVAVIHASHSSVGSFRSLAAHTIREGGCVVVNFSRLELGYRGSPFAGHMAPLAAYHERSDSFLMMDVAVKSWANAWVPAELLFKGMQTTDAPRDKTCKPCPRGFILVPSSRTTIEALADATNRMLQQ